MAARNHNTVAERQWRVSSGEGQDKMETASDKNRHCDGLALISGGPGAFASHLSLATSHCFLATLGDGHTMPSIFAATPSASTNVEKLMDTLFSAFGAAFCVRKAKLTLALTQEGTPMPHSFGPSQTAGR